MEPQHPQHRAIEKDALDFAGQKGWELERRETGGNQPCGGCPHHRRISKESPFRHQSKPKLGGHHVCLNREA